MNHTDARALILSGFSGKMGRDATRPEAQLEQSVGFLETGYAQTWKPPGNGSWNWGAIQGIGPAGSFSYTDTHPNSDGSSTTYTTNFAKYATAVQGAETLTQEVYQWHGRAIVLAAATRGDALAFSTALHTTGYYEGFGATVADRIEHHHAAVLNACRLMALELGEPMPDGSMPAPLPAVAIHQGSTGPAVTTWQRALVAAGYACSVDGAFGPKTRTLTIAYQKRLGVTMDGVVGPATRAAAGLAP